MEERLKMDLFVKKMMSSIVQIILFAAIPFVWWCITARKEQSFWNWIGFKKMDNTGKAFAWMIGVTLAFIFSGAFTLYLLKGTETATSEFAGLGTQAIMPILVYAIFNTALPEELLFRGFLLKRLESKVGFVVGNVVQAALFGLLHGIMFFPLVGAMKTILVIALTGLIAWFMGYINERKAGGSIFPSWIIHAISNIFSGICSAFLII